MGLAINTFCPITLEFRIATGNAGTGCAGEVQSEHGCEFAPVAGQNTICFEILSAPYKLLCNIRL